jgi:glycosyltransferase involved in cell wall biosynthesis
MQQSNPCVTIGIPVYNGENFLQEALDSIQAQTFPDFEIVISDNGSTDRTEEICRRYEEGDRRIRYFRNDINRGAAWNYNQVFALARAKYFRWHGHDDLIGPTYLEQCVAVLDAEPDVVIAYPKSAIIDGVGQVIRRHEDELDLRHPRAHRRIRQFQLSTASLYHPIFGLIRSDELKKTDLIGNFIGSDEILLWQLALAGQFREIPTTLFYRRYHPKASVVANPDYHSRAQWFDPNKKTKIYFKTWDHFFRRIKSIHRSELSPGEKIRVYSEVAKVHVTHPGWMVQDFITLYQQSMNEYKSRKVMYWTENTSMNHEES